VVEERRWHVDSRGLMWSLRYTEVDVTMSDLISQDGELV